MSAVKLNLSQSVPIQIDQGKNVVTMSQEVMTGPEPVIDALNTSNISLTAKQVAVNEARSTLVTAYAEMRAEAAAQRTAYGNLGALVQTDSAGEATYITSRGFGIRSSGTPIPPIDTAPANLRTRVNGVPGQVLFSWKGLSGARNYEAQKTSDLTGATGWESAIEMPSGAKLTFEGLTSGTKYAFRVRAWGNGMPGPWSTPVQQMVP